MSSSRALIVGAGLIGSSIGLALREAGWDVALQDSDATLTSRASAMTGLRVAEPGFRPELVVVAVPPDAVVEVVCSQLRSNQSATVIDVASVKSELANEIYTHCPNSDRYVPTHPMAGKETSGPAGAAFDLFVDRLWVYSPGPDTDPKSVALAKSAIEACGALAVQLPVAEHDATVALTSHLPQLLASSLAGLLSTEELSNIAVSGQGLRDMTRIAASNPRLWTEILLTNRSHVATRLAQLQAALGKAAQALETANASELEQLLTLGNVGRARIPGKHGSAPREWATVAIVINDAPGQLAAIFASAGRLGVNIEDVRIDHALGRAAAVIELDVAPDVAADLSRGLVADGWQLRHLPDYE